MSDIPEAGYRAALAGLEQQRAGFRRLAALTGAERTVLREEDLTVLVDLVTAGDDLLPDLERASQEFRERTVAQRQATGPRADALRHMVAATANDGRATSTALLRLLGEVRSRQEVVGRELQGLDPEEPVSLMDVRG
ncbi:MAG: hypothetical protein ABI587_00355 [Gemmatimonadales bacterium]